MEAPYPRTELERWHDGQQWKTLVSHQLGALARKHGVSQFRLRKGSAKEDVKEVCEEALPLANLLSGAADLVDWQGKLSPRNSKADAWLRSEPQAAGVPIQIVGSFDGAELAADMLELNGQGFTTTKVGSGVEIEDDQADRVVSSILKKNAKSYPAEYWLIVGVEELFFRLSSMKRLIQAATAAARETTFQRVYLVGLEEGGSAQRVK